MAETACYPLDSIKVWVQTAKHTSSTAATAATTAVASPLNKMKKKRKRGVQWRRATPAALPLHRRIVAPVMEGMRRGGGARVLFKGLPLGVARNSLSTMVVMGLNVPLGLKVGKVCLAIGLTPLFSKIVISSALSVAANSLLVPLETVKTRIQADSNLPAHKRRYTSTAEGFRSIIDRAGVRALWAASFPTYLRSALWWSSTLPAYIITKRNLVPLLGDDTLTHTLCSVVSGVIGTLCSQPADVIKTCMQNQKLLAPQYENSLHCLYSVTRKEGVRGLLRGFWPRYARLGPWQLIFFVCYERFLILVTGSALDVE